MISKNPAELQASPSSEAQPGIYEVPVLSPRSPIEPSHGGGGTTGDPGATDTRPPGIADLELLA